MLYELSLVVPESSGGRYLIRQGDINVGSHVNAIFRLRCRSCAPLGASHEMQVLMQDKRHTTYFGRTRVCTCSSVVEHSVWSVYRVLWV